MISIFHGNNAETHKNYQAWRKANVDGFHMSQSAASSLSDFGVKVFFDG